MSHGPQCQVSDESVLVVCDRCYDRRVETIQTMKNMFCACPLYHFFLPSMPANVSTAVKIDPQSALAFPAMSVQSAFHFIQVSLFDISARSYQIDVALSNGVGFQPIRIVVLLLFRNLVRCLGGDLGGDTAGCDL